MDLTWFIANHKIFKGYGTRTPKSQFWFSLPKDYYRHILVLIDIKTAKFRNERKRVKDKKNNYKYGLVHNARRLENGVISCTKINSVEDLVKYADELTLRIKQLESRIGRLEA